MKFNPILRRRGFSLIELMITLAIFVLLITLAFPMYGVFMGNAQIRNASEAMLDGVRQAQAQALRSNLPTVFTLKPASGWQITTDNPDPPPATLFTRDYFLAEGATRVVIAPTPADTTEVTFDGMGRIIANTDASNPIRTIDITHVSLSGTRPLRVIVSNSTSGVGTMLCDPDAQLKLQVPTPPQACP